MAYARGEIVLLPFPFTDLRAQKTRPAVIVSLPEFEREIDDVTVALVTSQPRSGPFDCAVRDWRAAGLLAPSWVRARLATLSTSLVRFAPGKLARRDLAAVEGVLRSALGL